MEFMELNFVWFHNLDPSSLKSSHGQLCLVKKPSTPLGIYLTKHENCELMQKINGFVGFLEFLKLFEFFENGQWYSGFFFWVHPKKELNFTSVFQIAAKKKTARHGYAWDNNLKHNTSYIGKLDIFLPYTSLQVKDPRLQFPSLLIVSDFLCQNLG